jgi:hypothetical protein
MVASAWYDNHAEQTREDKKKQENNQGIISNKVS